MKKLKSLFRQREFQILLFGLSVLLFSYPLIIMSTADSLARVYISLFVPWLFVILVLVGVGMSQPVRDQRQHEDNGLEEMEEVNDV